MSEKIKKTDEMKIDIIEAIHSIVRIALRKNSSELMKLMNIPKDKSLLSIPKTITLKQIKEASEKITTNYNSSYYQKSLERCDEIIMKELNDYVSKKPQDEKYKFPYSYSRICELADEKKLLENKIKDLEKENKKIKENISLLEHNNKTLQDKLTEVTKEKQSLSEYRTKYRDLLEKYNKLFDEKKNDLKSKIDEKSLNKKLHETIDNAIDKLNSQISVIDSSKDDKIKELENKIKDSENKNKELENKYKDLLREIETLRNINQSLVENKFNDFINNF